MRFEKESIILISNFRCDTMSLFRRRDGIGRRAGFKIQWWHHRIGSTPIAGTTFPDPAFSGAKNKSGSASDPLVFLFATESPVYRLIFRNYRFAVVVIAVGAHSVRNFRFATL